MNALDLLKKQHQELKKMFQQMEKLEGGGAEKERAFARLADAIAAHAAIEERYFYPAVNVEETEELLLESAEEHLAAKRVLADLLDLNIGDRTFDPKIKILEELVINHSDEEERRLMPLVKELVDAQALDDLGIQLEEAYDEIIQEEPRANVPAETDAPAHIS